MSSKACSNESKSSIAEAVGLALLELTHFDTLLFRGEGLILKQTSSQYHYGGRGKAWTKIKPDYMDEMGENCDLLVLGGWYGSGKRGGKLSSLLLGLRIDGKFDTDGQTPLFATFVKVGTGLNLSDYEWIK